MKKDAYNLHVLSSFPLLYFGEEGLTACPYNSRRPLAPKSLVINIDTDDGVGGVVSVDSEASIMTSSIFKLRKLDPAFNRRCVSQRAELLLGRGWVLLLP